MRGQNMFRLCISFYHSNIFQVAFEGPAQWPEKGVPMGVKRNKKEKDKKNKKKDSKRI